MEELDGYFFKEEDFMYADNLYVVLNCYLHASDSGFENGLIVGMTLVNSGII